MSLHMLPDDVLLEIFDFYMDDDLYMYEGIEPRQSLVHVCRQWRKVVFGSPRRLKLRLSCTTKAKTPVRDTLDIWPPFPLVLHGDAKSFSDGPKELDNMIAVLERSDRVCFIDIGVSNSHLEIVSTAMQKPFPKLTHMWLESHEPALVVPDSFLGGSAPRLENLSLTGIPFPGLPKLLLSATHLIDLSLYDIPHSGYFSPEAIVAALHDDQHRITLSWIPVPQSLPSRRPPPLTRSVLSTLSSLDFKGVSEYLEDLAAHIDAPELGTLGITFFNQIVFDAPQTIQFINRTPRLKALENARHLFDGRTPMVHLKSQRLVPLHDSGYLSVATPCREPDWQVSFMEQICTSCLPPLLALEELYFYESSHSPPDWKDNIEDTLWLELLHPFFAVKNLYLSEKMALRIAPALQELVGDRTTEVLPTLRNIFLEGLQPSGPDQEGIVKFVAARQLSGHPVTVSFWEGDEYAG